MTLLLLAIAAAGLVSVPWVNVVSSLNALGGRSHFRPLDGRNSGEIAREAARRRLDYEFELKSASAALIANGCAFAAIGVDHHESLGLWVAVGVGFMALGLWPLLNVRTATREFGVLLAIEDVQIETDRQFGEAAEHVSHLHPHLRPTVEKIKRLRGLSDDREQNVLERLMAVREDPTPMSAGNDGGEAEPT